MTRARNTADQINRVDSSAADATAITIDSSENVLVGTTDTTLYNNTTGKGTKIGGDGRLDVARQADTVATFNRTGSSDGEIIRVVSSGTTIGAIGSISGDIALTSTANPIRFSINNSERMRIDSSGTLLVGKTASDFDGGVFEAGSGGTYVSRSGMPFGVNRNGSNGTTVNLYKDGTLAGEIGCTADEMYLGSGDAGLYFWKAQTKVIPWKAGTNTTSDNAIDLGHGSYRWKDLYLSGGVYLGGTGSANKLDDYEEGTWTATGNGITLADQESLYVKVGKIVHIGSKIVFPTTSAGGDARITGLPFTCTNSQAARAGITISWHNEGSSNGLAFLVIENSTEGIFYLGASSKSNANMSGHTVYIGGTYLSDN